MGGMECIRDRGRVSLLAHAGVRELAGVGTSTEEEDTELDRTGAQLMTAAQINRVHLRKVKLMHQRKDRKDLKHGKRECAADELWARELASEQADELQCVDSCS